MFPHDNEAARMFWAVSPSSCDFLSRSKHAVAPWYLQWPSILQLHLQTGQHQAAIVDPREMLGIWRLKMCGKKEMPSIPKPEKLKCSCFPIPCCNAVNNVLYWIVSQWNRAVWPQNSCKPSKSVTSLTFWYFLHIIASKSLEFEAFGTLDLAGSHVQERGLTPTENGNTHCMQIVCTSKYVEPKKLSEPQTPPKCGPDWTR